MQMDLEADFRALVERASADLARGVIAILTARMAALGPAAPAATRAAPAARAKKNPGGRSGKPPARRTRVYAGPADAREKLVAVVKAGAGMSVGEIVKKSSQTRMAVQYGLRVLRKEKRVFMAGSRGFARWGGSAEIAQKAADAARSGG